jgi:hypothetical protein
MGTEKTSEEYGRGTVKNAYILVRKPKGKRLGKLGRTVEDNIKMNLKNKV